MPGHTERVHDPDSSPLAACWRAVCAACPELPARCLFRITEGFNVPLVLRHGTDRYGRDRPMQWRARGYRGRPRPFVDVLFASTAAEIDAGLAGAPGPTALGKRAITPDPHLLVYRAADLERVHTRQYAFKGPDRRAALLAVFALGAPVRRVI